MPTISWKIIPFSELTLEQLYAILKLRAEVFVIEQNCIYEDHDDKDQKCHHVLGVDEETNDLVAYSRLVPPGISFEEASIGRVLTSHKYRKNKFGIALMDENIAFMQTLYPNQNIRIGAQTYLLKFYESFGFVAQGEPYDEDGIEHIEMLLTK